LGLNTFDAKIFELHSKSDKCWFK